MRSSDWSSDVCSSDLARRRIPALTDEQRRLQPRLAVTRHALEIGFQDGNVHAVETRLSLIEVDEGIVNIDEALVDSVDDHPMRQVFPVHAPGTDQDDRNLSGFDDRKSVV